MLTKRNGLTLIFFLIFGFFLYYKGITPLIAEATKSAENNIYKQLELFNTVISRVQTDYVDEVSAQKLIYGALKGMLSSLDSHSQFMDPEEYKEMKIDTEGQFGGLGIEITVKDHLLTVVSPIEDTPAYRAGIQPEDKIIKIDGKSTKNMALTEAVKQLRGKPGTKVKVNVLRASTSQFLEFTMVRDIIKIQSVKDVKMVAEEIGYIRITQFQEKTSDEVEKALTELEHQGMKGLILDLRNNPGGLLNEAVDVADKFIGGNRVIVSTKGRLPSQNKEYKSSRVTTHPDVVLVVLVNGGSASGSEIVAGAIQDWHRGILIGTKTFGKASVQSVLPLQNDCALRLTTAKYYTPAGRLIHKIGIEPDIVITYQKVEEKKAKEGENDGEGFLGEEESEGQQNDNEGKLNKKQYPPLSDNQMERAVDLMRGIIILEGKGKENIVSSKTPAVASETKKESKQKEEPSKKK